MSYFFRVFITCRFTVYVFQKKNSEIDVIILLDDDDIVAEVIFLLYCSGSYSTVRHVVDALLVKGYYT